MDGENRTGESVLAHAKATNAALPEPDLAPITTLEVNGVTLHHRDSGVPGQPNGLGAAPSRADGGRASSGQTYVLVHGLGGSLANWEPLWGFLAPRGRVLAPDLAGFGRTEAPAAQTGVRQNVELLAGYLEQLDLGPVVLVGNSMGGMIAALLARSHPHLVERLVLVDPVLPLHHRTRPQWPVVALFTMYLCSPLARFVIPRYVRRQGLERMGADGVLGVVVDPHRVPPWVGRRAIEETVAHAEHQEAVASLVRAAQSLVIASASRGYARALGELTMPVTLLHGREDGLVPVSAARRAAQLHPTWRYVEAPEVGHVPMFEVAEWVAYEIDLT